MTDYIESLYEDVCEKLELYKNEIDEFDNKIKAIKDACSKKCQNVEFDIDEQEKENRNKQKKLIAFINIAKSHANVLDNPRLPIPYDSGKLSRLSVQIDSNSRDDYFAEKLFTEAQGQLISIHHEMGEIENKRKLEINMYQTSSMNEIMTIKRVKEELKKEIKQYLDSKEFHYFISLLQSVFNKVSDFSFEIPMHMDSQVDITYGVIFADFPIPKGFDNYIADITGNIVDANAEKIRLPAVLHLSVGSVLISEYSNETENQVLKGIQNILFTIISNYGTRIRQYCLIDPIRYNNSSLGDLAPLTMGKFPMIDSVPTSNDKMRNKIKNVISEINTEDKTSDQQKSKSINRIITFHNFPQSYDTNSISQIQQLCVNAEHYGLLIILTNNTSINNGVNKDTIEYIETMSKMIYYDSDKFTVPINSTGKKSNFEWLSMPPFFPDRIQKMIAKNEEIEKNLSNDYDNRIGITANMKSPKGIRQLKEIPFAIDKDGNILTLDFENSNFATFVCGASRSGKSTLLQTIVAGIIQNNHPDDVELWLIDFKMTEFGRYAKCMPPHVRYIILDESPELIFDIIDRLTEIMNKRQNIFKGKWLKLGEVPPEKYMPAILVIIDEFSIMSKIISDTQSFSNDDYRNKLQTLLAKGAALGLHFIFASQGFTSGTVGLNDFSKKQIQQRIALKTESNEIKETLDLKSASDDDKAMMEQLPVHHVLIRVPQDDRGNHLLMAKVLYISDYSKLDKLINKINEFYKPAKHYDANNQREYINKKPMVVDGNSFVSFSEKSDEMLLLIQQRDVTNKDHIKLFIGEPRRMIKQYPLEIVNGYCENIMIIAPISERQPAISILLSIMKSLEMQNNEIEIMTSKENDIDLHLSLNCNQKLDKIKKGLSEVCNELHVIKTRILKKEETCKFIFLFGFDSLMMDMSFQENKKNDSFIKKSENSFLNFDIEKREDGAKDLLQTIGIKFSESDIAGFFTESANNGVEKSSFGSVLMGNEAYDAREDLKFILTQGPKLGYHFVILFNTISECKQQKINYDLFKHKIMFRAPRSDANELGSALNGKIVSTLDNHSFRYSDGLDTLSFRPYLHQGISWDGWILGENGVENIVNEEDEYLL